MLETKELTSESENPAYEPKKVKRAFWLLSIDSILFYTGIGILDQSTIIPAFLATLTSNTVIIGAVSAIKPAMYYLPQIWVAYHLRNHTKHKGYLIRNASMSRIGAALFAILMLLSGPQNRTLMLWGFIAMYTMFWLTEGLVEIPWMDLTAKTIPERQRGRLYGFTQFGGAILALGSAYFASVMLAPTGPQYPRNYAILWTYAAVFFGASLISLSFVKEPKGVVGEKQHDNFLNFTRDIGRLLVGHGQLKRVLVVQILMGFMVMAQPFFILYAQKTAGISGRMIGLFALVLTIGSAVSSGISGYMSDHRGPKTVIMLGCIVGLLAPLLTLISGSSLWLYGIVFFLVGCSIGSGWIGVLNAIMELAGEHERKSMLGLMNTATAPTLLFPILGGIIIRVASYQTLFIVTAAAFLVAIYLTVGLKPRGAGNCIE